MAYGFHWEWRGFGVLPAGIRERIERLPAKYPEPATVRDEYLWIPGCGFNLKLRSKPRSLKFKRLLKSDPLTGMELWEERADEDHPFAVAPSVAVRVASALGIRLDEPPGPLDREPLIRTLQGADPRLRVIAVDKIRRAREYRVAEGKLVVELAELTSPQTVTSVGIEDELGLTRKSDEGTVEAAKLVVARAVEALGLRDVLTPHNYVEAVNTWAEGGRLTF
jgi:hypothetical protein